MYKIREEHFYLEKCISLITIPVIYILPFILNHFTFYIHLGTTSLITEQHPLWCVSEELIYSAL